MRTHILFYSPDSYGLGHVRRTIALAEGVLTRFQKASALVLTGAPRANYFSYPERCDYMKLPSITKREDGCYATRDLDLTLDEAVGLRARVIEQAAAAFHPDVLLVDHNPLGLCGEILPTLAHVHRSRPDSLRVLGLRDVIDEPEAVRRSWAREGVTEILRTRYDLILVYGQREFFDPIGEYEIPDDVAAKTVFVGYVGRSTSSADPEEIRRRYAPRTGRLVLATVGGGGDGNVLVHAMLGAADSIRPPPFETLVVTGPLMSPGKRNRFHERAAAIGGITILEHVEDLPGLVRAADFVVSMGGYNTVCELASAGARALIVPRVFPREEQLLRARRLERRGMVRVLLPGDATPAALLRECLTGLERGRPGRWGLELTAVERTSSVLADRLGRHAVSSRPTLSSAERP